METKKQREQSALMLALGVASELGFLIAIPVVVLGFGGAYADKSFGTSPLFLLAGIGLSLLISGVGIYRKLDRIVAKMNQK